MNTLQANQIADLINRQNKLLIKFNLWDIHSRRESIIFSEQNGMVVGTVQVNSINWYMAEIEHLSVAQGYKRQGIGRKMLAEAEIKAGGALLLQAVIRSDNRASIRLFESVGYHRVAVFKNPESGNLLEVYQKVINQG